MKLLMKTLKWAVLAGFLGLVAAKAIVYLEGKVRAAEAKRPATPDPGAWPSAELAKLRAEVVEKTSKLDALGPVNAEAIRDCVVYTVKAKYPDGPGQVAAGGTDAAKEAFSFAGASCADQVSQRLLNSETWLPEARAMMAFACTEKAGAQYRRACECMADEAPHYFTRPRAFHDALSLTHDELNSADRNRLGSMRRTCKRYSPE